jgi:hypothetical protein
MTDKKKIKDEELEKITGAGNEPIGQVELDPQPAQPLDNVFEPRKKKYNELDD